MEPQNGTRVKFGDSENWESINFWGSMFNLGECKCATETGWQITITGNTCLCFSMF